MHIPRSFVSTGHGSSSSIIWLRLVRPRAQLSSPPPMEERCPTLTRSSSGAFPSSPFHTPLELTMLRTTRLGHPFSQAPSFPRTESTHRCYSRRARHAANQSRMIFLPSSLACTPRPILSNSLNSKFADSSGSLSKSTSTPFPNGSLRVCPVAILPKHIRGGFLERRR